MRLRVLPVVPFCLCGPQPAALHVIVSLQCTGEGWSSWLLLCPVRQAFVHLLPPLPPPPLSDISSPETPLKRMPSLPWFSPAPFHPTTRDGTPGDCVLINHHYGDGPSLCGLAGRLSHVLRSVTHVHVAASAWH